jgi:predicted ribosome quality control (RQC) complex YloA/Tae2 family protein
VPVLLTDPYDILTIAAVTDELSATIGNGRVQRIGLVDARTIGAEIYAGGRRRYLIASADDQRPRLRLADAMPSLDTALVTPFGLLLRKHVRGGVILGIDQPPLERLVRLSIAKRRTPLKTDDETASWDEENGEGEESLPEEEADLRFVTLVVELMGRHSNLILVDNDGLIMESAKRVTPAMSRVRIVLPRLPYVPPPPLDRPDPRAATGETVAALLGGLVPDADLSRALVSGFRGVSPTVAREVAFRVAGASDARAGGLAPDAPEVIARELRVILEPLRTGDWRPRVYRERDEEDEGAVVTFAAIPMAHLAAEYHEEAIASLSEAAALAEGGRGRAAPVRHAQRRERLLAAVSAARERAERRLASLAEQLARVGEAERLKTNGELIYAYLWQIELGQTALEVEGERIPLDPDRSPSENAQAYFERYRKAQGASVHLPALEEETRAEIAYLEQLATLVAQAPGFAELEALAAEWSEGQETNALPGARPKRKRAKSPGRPRPLLDDAGNAVYIGRSGPQNDLITFDLAGPDDTWLHARDVGGSHVIVRWQRPDAPEDEQTIAAAAALAAWYSAARESGAVEVDVARRRHVRKIKGGRPGMVTYRNERTIRVQPLAEAGVREILRER